MADTYLMYLRKSRADGEHETVEEVLAKHYKMLQEYANAKLGHPIPEKYIYSEIVSGETIQDRPEVKRLLERIQNRDIKGVLVVEPQRLSRGDLSDCGTIIRAFRYTETIIVTPTKTFDLNDKFDRKFFEMELMRGNDYLEYIKEILNRGKIASVKEGNYLSPTPPYGYDKAKIDKCFTLVPNNESSIVKMIYELYTKEGFGVMKIANYLNELHIKPRKANLWNAPTITAILKNPVYIGKVRWNNRHKVKKYENGELISSFKSSSEEDIILVDGKHEPIISEDTFFSSLARFGKTPKVKTSSQLKNPLAGIIRCKCGSWMRYYVNHHGEDRIFCTHQKYCGNRSASYKAVESEVIQTLKEILVDIEAFIDESSMAPTNTFKTVVSTLEKELEALEESQERLYSFLESGTYTEDVFKKRNSALAKRRAELKEAIEAAQQQEQSDVDYKQRYIALKEAMNALEDKSVSVEEKNRLLKAVIKSIKYSRPGLINAKKCETAFSLDITLI